MAFRFLSAEVVQQTTDNHPLAPMLEQVDRDIDRMRKAIVEPVFGQIKKWRGFRQFSLRGLGKVRCEWNLVCLTHNPLKLFRSGYVLEIA